MREPESVQPRQLLRQKEAAALLGISVATLRRYKDAPRVELPSPTGTKPILRYDPQALRLWWAVKQGHEFQRLAQKAG